MGRATSERRGPPLIGGADKDRLISERHGASRRLFAWEPSHSYRLATRPRTNRAATHHGASLGGGLIIREHDCVVLTEDIPDDGLKAGDIGTVIHIHQAGAGYEVEFMTLAGETVAIATLLSVQVRPIAKRDIAHVRELQSA